MENQQSFQQRALVFLRKIGQAAGSFCKKAGSAAGGFCKKAGCTAVTFAKWTGRKSVIFAAWVAKLAAAFGKWTVKAALALWAWIRMAAIAFWSCVWKVSLAIWAWGRKVFLAFLDRFQGRSMVLLAVNCVLLALIVTGAAVMGLNVYAGGVLYPRSGDLDLRGQDISPNTIDTLIRKKPGCEILWDVPFQGRLLPSTTRELTVTRLSDEDLSMLRFFPDLTTLDGTGCADHKNLIAFREQRSDCRVLYNVSIGGALYDQDTVSLTLTDLSAREAEELKDLPYLADVQVSGCQDYPLLQQLQQEQPQWNLRYTVSLAGQEVAQDTQSMDVRDPQYEELAAAMTGLTALQSIHMVNPQIPAAQLLELQEQYPQVALTWEVEIGGKTYGMDTVELDLSYTQNLTCEQVETAVMSLPILEKLDMSFCGIDNETMAAYRERQRENYKVVWTVEIGDKCICRTDADIFVPIDQGEYYFSDADRHNLMYCEDMVCLDLGHAAALHNVEFLAYMPKLKYLILAHSGIRYIDPIVNCQELVYLEVDWSEIQDYTPIAQLKKLEDLNLSMTTRDITPILEMTWLKNLWAPYRSAETQMRLLEALPNTNISLHNKSGWRKLDGYYAMRDYLGKDYMID